MSIRFAAIGLSHAHIYNMVTVLLKAGAELVWFFSDEPENITEFTRRYPQVKQARAADEIFEDSTIQLVVSAAVPIERPALGMRAMQSGKDYLCAKPGFVTLEQLAEVRRVHAETGRKYIVYFGERIGNPATVKASELVAEDAIGRVIHMTGMGPHRFLGHAPRPPWARDKHSFGGIINDLASHQIDQFLYFTRSSAAEIVSAQVGNVNHTQFPNFEDFGDLTIRSDRGAGYIRVDWLTPAGLNTWGDGRLFLLGTHGTIEIRKNCDLAGRPGGDHLFLVDQHGTHYIEAAATPLPFAVQLIHDLHERTETAIPQEHCFLASELALIAQQKAQFVLRPLS